MDSISIRKATISDIPSLVKLRRLMFESMGHDDDELLEAGDSAAENYFKKVIPTEEFHGWVAVNSKGVIVSNIGLIIDQHPPGPRNLSGKIAYLMNLCTLCTYRRQGIARKLLEEALTKIEQMGINKVTLHATEMGKELYTQLGFTKTSEMRLLLK
ncbi:MAG: GNAT family N-acetyltransferase [Candidatus Hodarchaeales archaeon]|jgi:ribosomal protein S18 acetylase RimI-like enzyme